MTDEIRNCTFELERKLQMSFKDRSKLAVTC